MILHRDKLVDVTEPMVNSKQNLQFYCVKCDKPSKTKGALWMCENWFNQFIQKNPKTKLHLAKALVMKLPMMLL